MRRRRRCSRARSSTSDPPTITTAGTDRNSLCYQLHKRGLDVLNGITTDLDQQAQRVED